MSIINEALKKTQTRLESTKATACPKTPLPLKKEGQPEEKNVWLWIALIAISAGFAGCVVVFILFTNSSNRTLPNLPITKINEQKPTVTSIAPKNPPLNSPSKKKSINGLVLNGIITTGRDHTALINDSIYKVGDDIDGKKITQITADKVEVLYKGKTFTLTTK